MKLSAATAASLLMMTLFATFDKGKSSAVSGAAMVNTVLDGAAKLSDIIKLLDEKFLKPITEKVDREIHKIDTSMDGLSVKEKQLVFQAKLKLRQGRSEISATRTLLMNLAKTTIWRSNQLLRIVRRLSNGGFTSAKEKQGISLVVTKMRQLIERSKLLLTEAKQHYSQVKTHLEEVQHKLASFKNRVTTLAEAAKRKFRRDSSETRILSFIVLTAIAGPLWGPLSSHIYSTDKIKQWKDKLDGLLTKCDESKASTNKMIEKINTNLNDIETEKNIISTWQEHVALLFDDFTSGDYVVMIEWDDVGQIKNLENLIKVCEEYIQHANLASNRF